MPFVQLLRSPTYPIEEEGLAHAPSMAVFWLGGPQDFPPLGGLEAVFELLPEEDGKRGDGLRTRWACGVHKESFKLRAKYFFVKPNLGEK